jgi:hypothetical protein
MFGSHSRSDKGLMIPDGTCVIGIVPDAKLLSQYLFYLCFQSFDLNQTTLVVLLHTLNNLISHCFNFHLIINIMICFVLIIHLNITLTGI